jgi:AbrB family looped-hinge helix DNA binding protein
MVDTVRMSSKGQIVIPQDIREDLHADEGTVFAVMASGDCVILKKIDKPSTDELMKDLERIAREGRKRLTSLGIHERDIPKIVEKRRRLG